jgi:hypothetical protein
MARLTAQERNVLELLAEWCSYSYVSILHVGSGMGRVLNVA